MCRLCPTVIWAQSYGASQAVPDLTVLPATETSEHSPPQQAIQLLLHLTTLKGWKAELA